MVPECIIGHVWNARIEADCIQLPALPPANLFTKQANIVIWIRIPERAPGRVKEILAVDEDYCPLDGGFSHDGLLEKNNPARGLSAYRAGSR